MGFPILSLIVTRIIGIPQSLLLRVVGIPQFSPWVYGIPHALFCLSPKVFFSGFGIPQFSPGVYGIPHALLRLSPKAFSFFSYPSGYLFWSLWHSKALFTDLTSVIPRGLPFFSYSFLRGIHDPLPAPRNYPTSLN